MGENPIRYENIVSQIRRDIVMGLYPIGTCIKPVSLIREENQIGMATGYKIYEILEGDGLVEFVKRKGCVVIPFDQELWLERIQQEAIQKLRDALNICKQTQIPDNQITTLFQLVCENQLQPVGSDLP